jgi:outer membrane lipoprotein SlyB
MPLKKYRTALFLGGATAGAVSGLTSGMPGHRKDAAIEGAISGGVTGLAIASTPFVLKKSAGVAKAAFKTGAAKAKAQGRVLFRRVRGRLVPIRMK